MTSCPGKSRRERRLAVSIIMRLRPGGARVRAHFHRRMARHSEAVEDVVNAYQYQELSIETMKSNSIIRVIKRGSQCAW